MIDDSDNPNPFVNLNFRNMTTSSISNALDWLSNVAWKKPRTLAIILMALGLLVSARVNVYQQKRIVDLETSNLILQDRCTRRVDSITLSYSLKEERLNAETKATLNAMIEDYKRQLREQRDLDRKVNNSIIENEKTLRNNEQKLKQLQ